jgi:signal recognition particle subunit SRP54
MLETISKGFRTVKHRFQGKRELTEENIDEALRDIRVSLLEADVDFKVVRQFIAAVKEKAVGEVVRVEVKAGSGEKIKVNPGDHFINLCHQELQGLMGPVDTTLKFGAGVTKIMMVGLQGSGKTTTTGKLARMLVEKGRKPLLVAADIYRPAAVDQLKVLGQRLNIPVYHEPNQSPPHICQAAVDFARAKGRDIVIFDTAGRLAIDEALMGELDEIKKRTRPDNILLVVDSMIGQDAVRTAKTFDERIGISGFIMTKLDGDARGGAALSIKAVTGKPIKFLGMGEGLEALEEFRPEGLAGRIMGFGDVVGLMSDFQKVVDEETAEEIQNRARDHIARGHRGHDGGARARRSRRGRHACGRREVRCVHHMGWACESVAGR